MNAAASTATLETLREQHEALTLRAECAHLEQFLRGQELTARMVESEFGELVNRREYLHDTPGWGYHAYDQRTTTPDDRKRGKCRPFYETEQDLAMIRGIGRYLAGAGEIGIGLLETLVNYTIGTGFIYEAEPLEESSAAANDPLVKDVQSALDEILEANHWTGDQEAEAFSRAVRDGETMLWVQDEGGMPIFRTVEPDYLTEPLSTSRLEEYLGSGGYDWSFGIATLPGRHDRPYGYFIQWEGSASDWDVAPAAQVVHMKRNVDRGVKRGISDYYGPFQSLDREAKLFANTVQGAAIQASIAYIREHASGTTADQMTAFRGSKVTNTAQVATQAGGSKTIYGEKLGAGRIIDTAGTKYHAGPLGQPSHGLFVDVMQAALRRVGIRWQMPEFMSSGDASNANYASTLVSGSPFVRATERRQAFLKTNYERLLWIALGVMVRRGRFSGHGVGTITELKQRVQLKIEAPAVAIEGKLEGEQVREIQKRNGILSPRTWAGQVDLDYDIEVANGAKEPMPTLSLGLGQSGGGGLNNPDGNQNEPRQAAMSAALESVRTTTEARSILAELYP